MRPLWRPAAAAGPWAWQSAACSTEGSRHILRHRQALMLWRGPSSRAPGAPGGRGSQHTAGLKHWTHKGPVGRHDGDCGRVISPPTAEHMRQTRWAPGVVRWLRSQRRQRRQRHCTSWRRRVVKPGRAGGRRRKGKQLFPGRRRRKGRRRAGAPRCVVELGRLRLHGRPHGPASRWWRRGRVVVGWQHLLLCPWRLRRPWRWRCPLLWCPVLGTGRWRRPRHLPEWRRNCGLSLQWLLRLLQRLRRLCMIGRRRRRLLPGCAGSRLLLHCPRPHLRRRMARHADFHSRDSLVLAQRPHSCAMECLLLLLLRRRRLMLSLVLPLLHGLLGLEFDRDAARLVIASLLHGQTRGVGGWGGVCRAQLLQQGSR